jgi:hypothetical protein
VEEQRFVRVDQELVEREASWGRNLGDVGGQPVDAVGDLVDLGSQLRDGLGRSVSSCRR